MPSVECIVPLAGDCQHRRKAWEWVRERLPYPVRTGSCDGPWIKARAIYPAVASSGADIVVIHDADVWCEGLPEAVAAVEENAGWAMPHTGVHRLAEEATERVLAGAAWDGLPLTQPAYKGWEGGGIVVMRRATFLDCPLDPRFVGWGQEDDSWGLALHRLYGPPTRLNYPLVHLWHPPQQRLSRRRGSTENWRLMKRYVAARTNPLAMRSLIEEAKRDLHSYQQALHDSDALGVGV